MLPLLEAHVQPGEARRMGQAFLHQRLGSDPMSTMAATTSARATGMTKDEKFVIFASSLGTVFEWYDFYLYATLAPFFAALFFPPGNDTAALLSAFATYAAGFLVRPFGAIIWLACCLPSRTLAGWRPFFW
jgi:hypothetical protein